MYYENIGSRVTNYERTRLIEYGSKKCFDEFIKNVSNN